MYVRTRMPLTFDISEVSEQRLVAIIETLRQELGARHAVLAAEDLAAEVAWANSVTALGYREKYAEYKAIDAFVTNRKAIPLSRVLRGLLDIALEAVETNPEIRRGLYRDVMTTRKAEKGALRNALRGVTQTTQSATEITQTETMNEYEDVPGTSASSPIKLPRSPDRT
jgi:hypothetical protein